MKDKTNLVVETCAVVTHQNLLPDFSAVKS